MSGDDTAVGVTAAETVAVPIDPHDVSTCPLWQANDDAAAAVAAEVGTEAKLAGVETETEVDD